MVILMLVWFCSVFLLFDSIRTFLAFLDTRLNTINLNTIQLLIIQDFVVKLDL